MHSAISYTLLRNTTSVTKIRFKILHFKRFKSARFPLKCTIKALIFVSLVRASFGSRSCAPDESGRTKKMITGYPFSCTTLCTRVGDVEDGSSLFSACLFYSSSLNLLQIISGIPPVYTKKQARCRCNDGVAGYQKAKSSLLRNR